MKDPGGGSASGATPGVRGGIIRPVPLDYINEESPPSPAGGTGPKSMKFTKKTDYALRTMQYLARLYYDGTEGRGGGPAPVPVQAIAEASHLSLRFLQGIVS